MNDLFNQDNLFNRVMTKVFDLALLNIFWMICCLPVITIGASTIALYTVTLKMTKNEEGGIARSFFGAFKSSFRQSVPVTLILLACTGVLAADFHILGRNTTQNAAVLYGGCLVLTLFLIAFFSYVFPLFAKFDNTVRNTFSNAWRIAATHLPKTLLIVFVNCIPFLWLIFSSETFSRVFWIWVLLGTAASAYCDSFLLNGIFDEFITETPEKPDAGNSEEEKHER